MKSSRPARWAGLVGVTLLVLGAVLVPIVLIRPFAPQTEAMLVIAYWLRRWSPVLTLLGAGCAVLLVVLLWRGARRVRTRVGLGLLALLPMGAAWFARQNHFEWIFAPLPGPGFVRAGEAGFVRPDDMVLAVTIRGDAAAYPVRQLAYHHLVEDRVGQVPIVATY